MTPPDTDSLQSQRLYPVLKDLAGEEPVTMTVRGSSMLPTLCAGQRVSIVSAGYYFPGDIVAFRSADGPIYIHRLLGFRPRGRIWNLVARGDAAANCDAPVSLEHLLGKVVAVDGRRWRTSLLQRVTASGRFLGYLLATLLNRLTRRH